MTTADEVLAKTKALLDELKFNFNPKAKQEDFHRKYMEPPRSHKCFNVLAPKDYEWSRDIHDFYPGDLNNWSDIDTATVVIHGHEKGKVCQNRDLCHIMGWRPVGNEHVWFLKEWRKFGYEETEEGTT